MKKIFAKRLHPSLIYIIPFIILLSNACKDDDDDISVQKPLEPTITAIEPTSGHVGTEVTIIGTDFPMSPAVELPEVFFNGQKAVVKLSEKTTIKATVPSGAITGAVTIAVNGSTEVSGPTFTAQKSLSVRIASSEDDAEESTEYPVYLTSSDLELGEFDTYRDPHFGVPLIGLRFTNITIPQGSKILSAAIQFALDDAGGMRPVTLTIHGEAVNNANSFTNVANNISGRRKTTSNVIWSVPVWEGMSYGTAGQNRKL